MSSITLPKAVAAVVGVWLVGASPALAQDTMQPMQPMSGMAADDSPAVPPVAGYSEGQSILFLHTEASDENVATLLSEMMGSPVLLVPALADTPAQLLANVYVFTNGTKGEGPFGPLGFQPDVFDHPPGDAGYTPLRRIVFVTWIDEEGSRVLTSSADVLEAITTGLITAEDSQIVVNMPFLTWPGGQR